MQELLTFSEVERAEQISPATRWRRIKQGTYETVPTGGTLANGQPEMGIPLACLSADGQARWRAHKDGGGTGGQLASPSPVALQRNGGEGAPRRCPGIPLTPDGLPDLAALEAAGRDRQAEEWNRRCRAVALVKERLARAEHGEIGAVWRQTAREFGVSKRTLRRWATDRDEAGPLALLPTSGRQPGERQWPEALVKRAKSFWLDQRRPSAAQVYEYAVRPWCTEQGMDAPHPRTVRRWLDEVTPVEEVAFREGMDAWRARVAPKVVRDPNALRTNQVWVADHRLLDAFVVVPDGKGKGWTRYGKLPCPCGSGEERRDCCSLKRPWLTAIEDVRSGAIVGWRLGVVPTAAGVCHALKSAILSYGLPEVFVRDCGREFSANRLGGKAARLQEPDREEVGDAERWPAVMPKDIEEAHLWNAWDPPVRIVTTIPYHAWSKPIEALFSSFRSWENLVPGFCGRSAQDKPGVLEKHIEKGWLLAWDEFASVFSEQVDEWNASHVLGERGHPPDYFYMMSDYEPRIPHPRTIAFLIQDVKTLKVRQQGLKLAGTWYYSPALAPYVGLDVEVRFDEEDPEYAFVYPPGEEPIAVGRAKLASWESWGEANKEAKRGARLQRAMLSRTREDLKDALSIEDADPTGAFRMVADRVRRKVQERAYLPTEPQAEAAEEAHEAPERGIVPAALVALRKDLERGGRNVTPRVRPLLRILLRAAGWGESEEPVQCDWPWLVAGIRAALATRRGREALAEANEAERGAFELFEALPRGDKDLPDLDALAEWINGRQNARTRRAEGKGDPLAGTAHAVGEDVLLRVWSVGLRLPELLTDDRVSDRLVMEFAATEFRAARDRLLEVEPEGIDRKILKALEVFGLDFETMEVAA